MPSDGTPGVILSPPFSLQALLLTAAAAADPTHSTVASPRNQLPITVVAVPTAMLEDLHTAPTLLQQSELEGAAGGRVEESLLVTSLWLDGAAAGRASAGGAQQQ